MPPTEPMPPSTPDPAAAPPILYSIGHDFEEDYDFVYCDTDADEIRDFCFWQSRVIPCTREQAVAFCSEDAVQRAEKCLAERTEKEKAHATN